MATVELEKYIQRVEKAEPYLLKIYDKFWNYFSFRFAKLIKKIKGGKLEVDQTLFEEKLCDMLIEIQPNFEDLLFSFADQRISKLLNCPIEDISQQLNQTEISRIETTMQQNCSFIRIFFLL